MILLFSSILFGGCVRDVIDDVPGTDEDYAADKKDVVLIRMGTNDAEVKDITSRLFNNIPSSWEIGKKTIVDYDKMKDPETELNADIKNPKIYMTVILNVDDVISGKYPIWKQVITRSTMITYSITVFFLLPIRMPKII